MSDAEGLDMLQKVHQAYNAIGITSVGERRTNVSGYRMYEKLKAEGRLSVRANVTISLDAEKTAEGTEKFILRCRSSSPTATTGSASAR